MKEYIERTGAVGRGGVMADTKKFCIHSDGLGYCDILSDDKTKQYCVEGPCQHEKIVEYEPVWHGRWVYRKFVSSHVGAISGYLCSECSSFVNEDIFDSDEFRKVFCGCCGALMDLEGEG